LDAENLQNHFALNATAPAILMQALHPLMDREKRAVYAKLSARVGSISDNGLGGWLSYRASKAALNQIIKTVSIEWARKSSGHICLGLHPGTVDTPLSAKYVTQHQKLAPSDAAQKLLSVLDKTTASESGKLFDYNGLEIKP
jgi:NAD(P)-dependent dehydrogenase (short-subunit alcohol dehydrogenase family)